MLYNNIILFARIHAPSESNGYAVERERERERERKDKEKGQLWDR